MSRCHLVDDETRKSSCVPVSKMTIIFASDIACIHSLGSQGKSSVYDFMAAIFKLALSPPGGRKAPNYLKFRGRAFFESGGAIFGADPVKGQSTEITVGRSTA